MAEDIPPVYAAVQNQDVVGLREAVVGGAANVDVAVDIVRKVHGRTRCIEGDTALLLACELGDVGMVATLLEAGANACASREENDRSRKGTPSAELQGSKKKKRGLSILSINSTKSKKKNALCITMQYTSGDVRAKLGELLVCHGANVRNLPNRRDYQRDCPAVSYSFFSEAQVLHNMARKIKSLDLSHCKLKSLPAAMFQDSGDFHQGLVHLEILTLNFNKLTSIPEEICTLSNLRELHVESNDLVDLPLSLVQLRGTLVLLQASRNDRLEEPLPALLAKSLSSVMDHLADRLKESREIPLSAKILVCGHSLAGKSTLIGRLVKRSQVEFGGSESSSSLRKVLSPKRLNEREMKRLQYKELKRTSSAMTLRKQRLGRDRGKKSSNSLSSSGEHSDPRVPKRVADRNGSTGNLMAISTGKVVQEIDSGRSRARRRPSAPDTSQGQMRRPSLGKKPEKNEGSGQRRKARSEPSSPRNRSSSVTFSEDLRQVPFDLRVTIRDALLCSDWKSPLFTSSEIAGSFLGEDEKKKWEAVCKVNCEALMKDMTEGPSRLPTKTHTYKLRPYRQCFSGADLVLWLMTEWPSAAKTRIDATLLGHLLHEKGYFQKVGSSAKSFDASAATIYTFSMEKSSRVTIKVTAWDPSNHDLSSSTLRMFLSSRGIYIIAFDMRKPSMDWNMDYWLETVSSRIGKKAAVVLVGTHKDSPLVNEQRMAEVKKRLERKYRAQYPCIKFITGVAVKQGDGMEELWQALTSLIVHQVTSISPVPLQYGSLAKALASAKLEPTPPLFSQEEVIEVARSIKLAPSQVGTALQFLNDSGELIFWRSKDGTGQRMSLIVRDPVWFSRCIRSLAWVQATVTGVISKEALLAFWKEKGIEEEYHACLLKLLHEEELVFPFSVDELSLAGTHSITGSGHLLVPGLLPAEKEEFVYLDVLEKVTEPTVEFNRILEFQAVPPGLLPRFVLLLLGQAVELSHIWQTGAILWVPTAEKTDPPAEECPPPMMVYIEHLVATSCVVVIFRVPKSIVDQSFVPQAMRRALDLLTNLCSYWYGAVHVKYVACSKCLVDNGHFLAAHGVDIAGWSKSDQERDKGQHGQWPSAMTPRGLQDVHLFAFDYLNDLSSAGAEVAECKSRGATPRAESCDGDSNGEGSHSIPIKTLAPDAGVTEMETAHAIDPDAITFKKVLGEGSYGKVFAADYMGRPVAVKEFTQGINERAATEARKEILTMSRLRHKNLVEFIGYTLKPTRIVMEKAIVDLNSYLQDLTMPDLSWRMRLHIARDVAAGMLFLHSANPPMVHRDLKSPNILLVSMNEFDPVVAKVTDFGTVVELGTGQLREQSQSRDVQTPFWLAPEILEGRGYSEKADCYSMGIVMWELLTREHPYSEYKFKFSHQYELKIADGLRPTLPDQMFAPPARGSDKQDFLEHQVGVDYARLLVRCWDQRPGERPSFKEILQVIEALSAKLESAHSDDDGDDDLF